MTRTLEFLLAKDPVLERTGDMTMASLVMELAAEAFAVRYICLSKTSGARGVNTLVEKPRVSAARLLLASARHRQSLVHARFRIPAVTRAIESSDADTFVADHSYMAEPFADSSRAGGDLRVNSVVSESYVWSSSHGIVGRAQKSAIERDQLRVARLARSLATYDADEAEEYRAQGVRHARWLELSLEPALRHEHTGSAPRLAFMGDRTWAPNQEGYEQLLEWWPRIAAGIPDAELVIIGKPAELLPLPAGVRDLGFVDDLDGALNSSRAILAPIRTGGGVRVKILDAAKRGIPLVATGTAIGSLAGMFSLEASNTEDEFVEAARRLLLDRAASRQEGMRLYEQNRQRWESRVPHTAVAEWLA
ncbi:MAG: polysaccharide biosynthesis protein PslH [Subtercola sp.]|nr:polysaccharide biosynthesis protein PslH [Subtercola sp.]